MTLTEDGIRELAGFKGEHAPVTSCYLDVDGRRYVRPRDYELELERMLRDARERRGRWREVLASSNGAAASVEADLRRIEEHVRRGVDRSRVRGLAMFSSAAHGFFRAIELPVPVNNHLVANHTPHVRQLEEVVDAYEPMAVLLADRQRARLFVFELGELVEREELFDQLPRHDDAGGSWSRDHAHDHADALAHQHLRRAAQAAFAAWQERRFDHLLLGASDEITRELERELHPYLRERIAGRIAVAVTARDDAVRQAALDAEAAIERRKEAALVARLRDAMGAGSGAVVGVDDVLAALVERRVETLLVSRGFEAPGWRCLACGWVGPRGRACPVCSAEMAQVDDVVEEAVEEALGQSCRVETCVDNADLDVLGRIGALLRY